jgi:hypothetical protein
MSAIIVLITALLMWLLGTVAGFMLWGFGWGTLVWIGLTALFAQHIIMALMLTAGFIFFRGRGPASLTA